MIPRRRLIVRFLPLVLLPSLATAAPGPGDRSIGTNPSVRAETEVGARGFPLEIWNWVFGRPEHVRGEGDGDDALPSVTPGLRLHPVAPDPIDPRTQIAYDLPARAAVSLRVYDLRGRVVARLTETEMPAGTHTAAWSPADDLPSGVYLVRLDVDGHVRVRKATLPD